MTGHSIAGRNNNQILNAHHNLHTHLHLQAVAAAQAAAVVVAAADQ
jgi:hypothetical protein